MYVNYISVFSDFTLFLKWKWCNIQCPFQILNPLNSHNLIINSNSPLAARYFLKNLMLDQDSNLFVNKFEYFHHLFAG